jgi:hypothetical protein
MLFVGRLLRHHFSERLVVGELVAGNLVRYFVVTGFSFMQFELTFKLSLKLMKTGFMQLMQLTFVKFLSTLVKPMCFEFAFVKTQFVQFHLPLGFALAKKRTGDFADDAAQRGTAYRSCNQRRRDASDSLKEWRSALY